VIARKYPKGYDWYSVTPEEFIEVARSRKYLGIPVSMKRVKYRKGKEGSALKSRFVLPLKKWKM